MKRLAIATFVGALLLILAWQLLPSLLIRIPSLFAPEVGPPREVAWDAGPAQAAAPPGERPPNVVVILADDLGWNDLSFRGGGLCGGQVKTPRIYSIAQQGVSFTNGYAANATCAPSRAAILSGRYGTRFGFEFTPTPAVMAPLLYLARSSDPTPRRDPIPNPDFEPTAWEDMGMPASEITLAETLKKVGYHTEIGRAHV